MTTAYESFVNSDFLELRPSAYLPDIKSLKFFERRKYEKQKLKLIQAMNVLNLQNRSCYRLESGIKSLSKVSCRREIYHGLLDLWESKYICYVDYQRIDQSPVDVDHYSIWLVNPGNRSAWTKLMTRKILTAKVNSEREVVLFKTGSRYLIEHCMPMWRSIVSPFEIEVRLKQFLYFDKKRFNEVVAKLVTLDENVKNDNDIE